MKIKLAHGQACVEKVSAAWFLVSINVDPEYRESGVGTRLMNNILKKCGRPIYLLATDELGGDYKRLVEFYKRFGFNPYRQKRSDELPYNVNMVLER